MNARQRVRGSYSRQLMEFIDNVNLKAAHAIQLRRAAQSRRSEELTSQANVVVIEVDEIVSRTYDNDLRDRIIFGAHRDLLRQVVPLISWIDCWTSDVYYVLGILSDKKLDRLSDDQLDQWMTYLCREARRLHDACLTAFRPNAPEVDCPVSVEGPGEPIRVNGIPTVIATAKQYAVLKELIRLYPLGQTKGKLENVANSPDKVLKGLRKHAVLEKHIVLPGGNGRGGYRLK